MDEILQYAHGAMTQKHLREYLNTLSDGALFELIMKLLDVSHGARAILSEYSDPPKPLGVITEMCFGGVNRSAWVDVEPKWRDLAFRLERLYGLQHFHQMCVAPPLLYQNSVEESMSRCNIPRNEPAAGGFPPLPPLPPDADERHRRSWLNAAAQEIHVRLELAGERVTAVRIQGDTLDEVQIRYFYPLEWFICKTPGATTPEAVAATAHQQRTEYVSKLRKPQEISDVPLN